ncbi:MAG: C39 family peptidase [Terricaulis sp.]
MTTQAHTHSAPNRSLRLGAFLFGLVCLTGGPAAAQVRTHGEAGGHFTIAVTSWRDIPFRTVVRQQYDYSCGSAALATLLRYHYGVAVGESEVFQEMYAVGDQDRIREVGFSMLDMKHYLEVHGFAADGLRVTLDRLAALEVPAIALITHDNYRHFVVVKGLQNGEVLVGDPTFGLQTYTRAEFEAVWNGVILAVRRAPEGTAAPAFNRDEEWQDWAVAPIGDAPRPVSPSDLLRELPELYQIRQPVSGD